MENRGWNPWAALRERHDIILRWGRFPPGTNGRIVNAGRYVVSNSTAGYAVTVVGRHSLTS